MSTAEWPLMLPVITVWEPWASAMFLDDPRKVHETRHWAAPLRLMDRLVGIHAGKRQVSDADISDSALEIVRDRLGEDWRKTRAYGCVLGVGVLASCMFTQDATPDSYVDHELGNWQRGRYAWGVASPRKARIPLPVAGRQGIWYLSPEQTLQLKEQVHGF